MTDQLSFDSIMFPRDRKVLTVAEVAARLDCTDQHVIDLIDEGQLQALNIGSAVKRHWRIPKEAYEAFLRERHSFQL
jgi:excisionase family DNA binding protein